MPGGVLASLQEPSTNIATVVYMISRCSDFRVLVFLSYGSHKGRLGYLASGFIGLFIDKESGFLWMMRSYIYIYIYVYR